MEPIYSSNVFQLFCVSDWLLRWCAALAMAWPDTGEVKATKTMPSTANVMMTAFSVATDEANIAITPGPVAMP